MDNLTDEQREFMGDVNGHLSHTRTRPAGTKVLRDGEWAEPEGSAVRNHSMFPYRSTAMAVEAQDIPATAEYIRKNAEGPAKYTEFDREGRPIITSTAQHGDLAKTLGMKTGRDGFGHTDEFGRFHNSGRRRNDEIQEGRSKVRGAIQKLESMPEEVPIGAVESVLNEYDIRPTAENTG